MICRVFTPSTVNAHQLTPRSHPPLRLGMTGGIRRTGLFQLGMDGIHFSGLRLAPEN